jgi:hypothetical protein
MPRRQVEAHSEYVADELPDEGEGLYTMSVPIDNLVLSLALRGWRDRSNGTMHLGPCLDFETLDAQLIEDAEWRPANSYDRLCPACFPSGDDEAPADDSASESHGL